MKYQIKNGDSFNLIKELSDDTIHLILSDIPYGINYDEWDVLHSNKNSALLGTSPSQQKAGNVFKSRGKPLNGWSEEDRLISKQYYDFCMSFSKDWLRVLKPGASAFVFAGRRYAHRLICAMEDNGFIYKDMLAWIKPTAPYKAQKLSLVYERRGDLESTNKFDGWRLGNLRPLFEPILWFFKPYKLGGTLADNMLEHGVGSFNETAFLKYFNSPSNIMHTKYDSFEKIHPTQKPVELMKSIIDFTTQENHIVLDPFMGSGSTGIASLSTNREFIGYELNKEYFEKTKNRFKEYEKSLILFDN